MLNLEMLFITSIIWSFLWTVLLYFTIQKFPFSIAHDYPEDIVAAANLPLPDKKHKIMGIAYSVLSFIFVMVMAIVFVLISYDLHSLTFTVAYLHFFIMSMTWNLVDLIIIDWLMICTLHSKMFILANTENCAGNKDYMFHFKGFLKGIIAMAIMSLILTLITFVIIKFII